MIRPALRRLVRDAARLPRPSALHNTFRSNPARLTPKTHQICAQTRSQGTFTTSSIWSRLRATRTKPRTRNYSSEKPAPNVTSQLGSPEPQLGLKDKLKQLFKKYGYLSVGVYLALSALDFPFCFLAVRLAGPERIGQLEHKILSSLKVYTDPVWQVIEPVAGPAINAVQEAISQIRHGAVATAGVDVSENAQREANNALQEARKNTGAASIWTQLALAYGIHKTLLIFVRVPLAAALTPRIARALTKRGWRFGSKSS